MAREPLVYTVLVNWNGKDVTRECIRSLNAVMYGNMRIVLVDNASSDGSVQSIREEFPDVSVLEMQQNLRFAGGTNAGLRFAMERGAELLLLLNNDTIVGPGFLSAMVDRLLSDDGIGIVSPKIYYHDDPQRIWFAGGNISLWTGTMSHTGIREIDRGQYDNPVDIEYASGCCLLTRTSVAKRVGLLDESYHIYTEDADWSMRTRRAGYRIVYEPRAKVWHKLSVTSGGHLSWYKMKNKFISNLRFFGRYAAWYQWLVFPWMNLLVNGYAAVRYLVTARRP
jgi:hypothetical protein